MKEEWKDVLGFEKLYEVSSFGNVKKKDEEIIRKDGKSYYFESKMIKPETLSTGLVRIVLKNSQKVKKRFKVHMLVAEHFVPKEKLDNIITHKNGDISDNRASNLEWSCKKARPKKVFIPLTDVKEDREKGVFWKDIKNYEGFYEISNTGLVRGLDRKVFDARHGTSLVKGQLLSPEKSISLSVRLSNAVISKKRHKVQNLVYEAFIGVLQGNEYIVFKDGNRHNCSSINISSALVKAIKKKMVIEVEDLQGEEWKVIEGSFRYEISSKGRIKGISKKLLSPSSNSGYKRITIRVVGEKELKSTSIHRLVAKAFIPNKENKPVVNHINGDKLDNRVENLEWVTYSENTIHAHNNNLQGSATIVEKIRKRAKEILAKEQMDYIFKET